ncbi:MAG: RidA family protein [Oscillospiraceae bacterium]|nr:RidA family protein [Oscillospiraceae bacterium]
MGTAEQKLASMGIKIDAIDRTGKGTLACRKYKNLLFISGHGPFDMGDKPLMQGTVGVDLTPEQGYEAGRLTAVRMLATIKDAIGDLDEIDYFVKGLVIFNSGGKFYDMPAQANGFSDVITMTFGQRGRHARAAMGCGTQPRNVPVIVDMVLKLKD